MSQSPLLKDSNQRATTVKSHDISEISVAAENTKKNKLKAHKKNLATKTVAPTTPSPTTTLIITTSKTITTKTVKEPEGSHKLFFHPVKHAKIQTTP